ncbi:MAG: NusG domain II-containing protein [Clostridia bacterium]|nr:NusG domain II-containing protein [Clostridia bacterium]
MKLKNHRYDIILIASLIFISAVAIVFLLIFREDGKSVQVEIDGKTVAVYSLSEDGEYILNGGTNILVIEDGEAYIRDADCPDKTCVKAERISHVGESTVCLPNRLSVSVIGKDADGVDLVS